MSERRITPDQAAKAAQFSILKGQVEDFLEALEENGLLIDVTYPARANHLLEAKARLEEWFQGEEEDEDE